MICPQGWLFHQVLIEVNLEDLELAEIVFNDVFLNSLEKIEAGDEL